MRGVVLKCLASLFISTEFKPLGALQEQLYVPQQGLRQWFLTHTILSSTFLDMWFLLALTRVRLTATRIRLLSTASADSFKNLDFPMVPGSLTNQCLVNCTVLHFLYFVGEIWRNQGFNHLSGLLLVNLGLGFFIFSDS